MVYTGSCLCEGVSFQIQGELEGIQVCHCRQCRKAQGGAFAAVVPVSTLAFQLVGGEALLKSYESSVGKERVFCGRCGSPIFSRRRAMPGVVRVRAGLINEAIERGIAFHAYTESKCNWWAVEEEGGAPQYSEGAPS